MRLIRLARSFAGGRPTKYPQAVTLYGRWPGILGCHTFTDQSVRPEVLIYIAEDDLSVVHPNLDLHPDARLSGSSRKDFGDFPAAPGARVCARPQEGADRQASAAMSEINA